MRTHGKYHTRPKRAYVSANYNIIFKIKMLISKFLNKLHE